MNMCMYERVATLAALAARVEGKAELGSSTIGERVARLARACKTFDEAREDEEIRAAYAEVALVAEAVNLEAFRDAQGNLFVGRPHFSLKMNEKPKR